MDEIKNAKDEEIYAVDEDGAIYCFPCFRWFPSENKWDFWVDNDVFESHEGIEFISKKEAYRLIEEKEKKIMEQKNNFIERAIAFAEKAHEGQFRKGTDIPYIVHPKEAMEIVKTLTDDEEVIAAAVLHDVIEDTAYTEEDIRREFGDKVADLVCEESENKRKGIPEDATWKIRKTETIKELMDAPLDVMMICLGDKLSNARAIVRDYDSIGDKLWERFNASPDEIAWYYSAITYVLGGGLFGDAGLADTDAYKELRELMFRDAFNGHSAKTQPFSRDEHIYQMCSFWEAVDGRSYRKAFGTFRFAMLEMLRHGSKVTIPCNPGTFGRLPVMPEIYTDPDTGFEFAVMLTDPDEEYAYTAVVSFEDFVKAINEEYGVMGLVINPHGICKKIYRSAVEEMLDIRRREDNFRHFTLSDRHTAVETVKLRSRKQYGTFDETADFYVTCLGGDLELRFIAWSDFPEGLYDAQEETDARITMTAVDVKVFGGEKDYLENSDIGLYYDAMIPVGMIDVSQGKCGDEEASNVLMNARVTWVDENIEKSGNNRYRTGICRVQKHDFAFRLPESIKVHMGDIISGVFKASIYKLKTPSDDAVFFTESLQKSASEETFLEIANNIKIMRCKSYESVSVSFDGREDGMTFIQAYRRHDGDYHVEAGYCVGDYYRKTLLMARDYMDFGETVRLMRRICVDWEQIPSEEIKSDYGFALLC